MAHLIDAMAYAGATPWHKLGRKVDQAMTAAEAITLGGLDWEVQSQPMQTTTGLSVANVRAIVRMDRNTVLGVVTKQYKPLQNKDSFKVLDTVVRDGDATYHTVGSLDGGRKIWLLAKLPGVITPLKGDEVEKYLLVANAHDGTMAVRIGFTPIRVVCMNTLKAALVGLENGYTIHHRGDFYNRFDDARKALGLARQWYAKTEELYAKLASVSVTVPQVNTYLANVFPEPKTKDGKKNWEWEQERQRVLANRRTVERLAETGRGTFIPGVRGSAWGVFNAACEWADYHYQGTTEARLKSIWFGERATLKNTILKEAIEVFVN